MHEIRGLPTPEKEMQQMINTYHAASRYAARRHHFRHYRIISRMSTCREAAGQ